MAEHSRKRDSIRCFAKYPWCLAKQGHHKLRLATGTMFIADESSSIVAIRPLSIRRLSILQAAKPSSSECHPNLTASLPAEPERNSDTTKRQ